MHQKLENLKKTCADPSEVQCQPPKRDSFNWMLNVLVISAIGIFLSGCHGAYAKMGHGFDSKPDNSVVPGAVNPKPLTIATEKELKFSENDLAMVLSIDKKGNVQMFRPEGAKVLPEQEARFPLPAGNIKNMLQITIFETSNPKWCRLKGGSLFCIYW